MLIDSKSRNSNDVWIITAILLSFMMILLLPLRVKADDCKSCTSNKTSLSPPTPQAAQTGSTILPTSNRLTRNESTNPSTRPIHSKHKQSNRHGPYRHDPSAGIPRHAYSPFDNRYNQKQSDPIKKGDFAKNHLVIKLAPTIDMRPKRRLKGLTGNTSLNNTLKNKDIQSLDPIFPLAESPKVRKKAPSSKEEQQPKPDLTRWYRASLPDKANISEVIEALSSHPDIEYIEPDYLRRPTGTAEDPISSMPQSGIQALPGSSTDSLYDQQWHLQAAKVPEAWQWLKDNGFEPGGSRDVIVAVIDTGVDYTHPDLAANMWINSREVAGNGIDDDNNGFIDDIHGANVVSNQHSGDPRDDHGHGTHVAGIIASQANNNIGGVGVAYNVQIMAIKAAQYSGVLTSSDIAEGIYYAVTHGADVINMSFGGYSRSLVEEDALAVAFGQAVLVAAAGNDGRENLPCPLGLDMYPAAYNWVLGVMASKPKLDDKGWLASFSNCDCTPHDSHEYELMAPGVDIWSTLPKEQYAAWDGTSMAAPVVSGLAALLRTRWSDKDVYSSRFIMGQIAANASPVADAYAALTVFPQPELSYLEHWLFDTEEQDSANDDDGIVDAGETIDLAIVIRNHWGKADSVAARLEAWAEGAFQADPYVTMITDTVDYGAVGSFNWDDNGFIYEEDVITGVRHPFRFIVSPECYNDHLIPFRLTVTCRNGLDPSDTNEYTFQSGFYLIVQRGRELPSIISEDMTLTKDYYWIIPRQTLIESGVTVTITEGAQVQFGAPTPSDPYGQASDPFLQVEGSLLVQGTFEEPVELVVSELLNHPRVQIRNYGTTELFYTKIMNPILGYIHQYKIVPLNIMDHTYVSSTRPMEGGNDGLVICSAQLTNSILNKVYGVPPDWGYFSLLGPMMIDTVLVDGPIHPEGYNLWPIIMFGEHYQYGDFKGPILNSVFIPDSRTNSPLIWRFSDAPDQEVHFNAFLNKLWAPDLSQYMAFIMGKYTSINDGLPPRGTIVDLTQNYWGTSSSTLIDAMIYDYKDNFNTGTIEYQPILTEPPETAYPFVVDVILSTASSPRTTIVGAEPVTFTVTFNRDMDTSIQPAVSFGPDVPETDYTIHPIEGGWQNPRTWLGTFNITPVTGDGYQLIRIADAVAADDPWLVTGDDAGRFRFEIITSGTEAMNLQATGGEGYIDLTWSQDDFDLLAGFNLYRATSSDGTFTRLNSSIIPPDQRSYCDTDVQPGQPYYYKFTVVKTDMSESSFSNIATATPIDTIPPVINHTPITNASPGLSLTLTADVTDNVKVQDVTLYYRTIGQTDYLSKTMTFTSGSRYSATIEGSKLTSPGQEYYLEASDGISTVRFGRPEYPYQVTVVDKPIVTSVSPNHGPTSGATSVTIAGSNFKEGASVAFGGAVCENRTVVSPSRITCTTPAHYPAVVDVMVTNPDGQKGTLLGGFTYESDQASVSLPNTCGAQHAIVRIPVNAANIQGLAAVDLTVTFDSNVLRAERAVTGTLTPGWSIVVNTNTAGEIRLSMACTGGTVSGSGTLAILEFEVVGASGSTTTLHPAMISLNDGAIPSQCGDGLFTVDLAYEISGRIYLWNGNTSVPGVSLRLEGDRVYTGLTNGSGDYSITNILTGDYSLTPDKSGSVSGISAYDAALVLQHSAGLITLSGYQATAGDVDKNGNITSMDAFYILQKAVDLIALPFPNAGIIWEFSPSKRSYTNLNSNQSSQDFTALLLGDVSGNWIAVNERLRSSGSMAAHNAIRITGNLPAPSDNRVNTQAVLSLPEIIINPGEQINVPLYLDPNQAPVISADIEISYDPNVASAAAVQIGDIVSDWILVSNLETPGIIRLALAGSHHRDSKGELADIIFNAVGEVSDSTSLTFTSGKLNEGMISTSLQDGIIRIENSPQCSLDIDDNGEVKALTDGLLIMRYLFRYPQLHGVGWIDGVVASSCGRCTAQEIENYIESLMNNSCLDIDNNGEVKALTDGLLIMRYLFRYSQLYGTSWIDGVVASSCERCNAQEIENYIPSLTEQQ